MKKIFKSFKFLAYIFIAGILTLHSFALTPTYAASSQTSNEVELNQALVTVEKTWSDNNTEHAPITIRIGSYSVVLSKENNWKSSIAVSTDVTSYTVSEDNVIDYTPSFKIDNVGTTSFSPMAGEISISTTRYTANNNLEINLESGREIIVVKKGGYYAVWTPVQVNSTMQKMIASALKMNINEFVYGVGNVTNKSGKKMFAVSEDRSKISFYNKDDWSSIWYGTVPQTNFEYNVSVLNTYTPAKTDVKVTKEWNDNDNSDGIRPKEVEIKLLADGTDTGKSEILSEKNEWSVSFNDVNKYKNGVEIDYSVEETEVFGYTSKITKNDDNSIVITNTHEIETRDVTINKIWDDDDDRDGLRAAFEEEGISFELVGKVDDEEVVSPISDVILKDGELWSKTISNLPVYAKGGKEIVYSVVETNTNLLDNEYENIVNVDDNLTLINKHIPKTVNVNVVKIWDDNNNKLAKRPRSIIVVLIADGEETGKTLELSEQNDWKGSFNNLFVNNNGKTIKYEVRELAIEDYESPVINGSEYDFEITNKISELEENTPDDDEETDNEGEENVADDEDDRKEEIIFPATGSMFVNLNSVSEVNTISILTFISVLFYIGFTIRKRI